MSFVKKITLKLPPPFSTGLFPAEKAEIVRLIETCKASIKAGYYRNPAFPRLQCILKKDGQFTYTINGRVVFLRNLQILLKEDWSLNEIKDFAYSTRK